MTRPTALDLARDVLHFQRCPVRNAGQMCDRCYAFMAARTGEMEIAVTLARALIRASKARK